MEELKDKKQRGLLDQSNNKAKSPGRSRFSIEKDSMVQEILQMDFQSVPNNESALSIKDPFRQAGAAHKRINSASLDFYMSNAHESGSPKKKKGTSVQKQEQQNKAE